MPHPSARPKLREGEVVDFILRQVPKDGFKRSAANRATEATKEMAEQLGVDLSTLAKGVSKIRSDEDPILSAKLVESLIDQTNMYWLKWISKCTYKGRWREAVHRQALTLKMLVYEETGAIIAAPTFSLPEHIGGTRNWDYRFTWIRDSSFTLYALIRLGYTAEASASMLCLCSLPQAIALIAPASPPTRCVHGVHSATSLRAQLRRLAPDHVHHPWR